MSEVFGDAFLFLIFCQSFLKFYWDENQNCFSGYRKPIGSGGKKPGEVWWPKHLEGQVVSVRACAHMLTQTAVVPGLSLPQWNSGNTITLGVL